jgi:hypothetical protein
MTTGVDPRTVRELAGDRPGPCVSLYLPAPGGREAGQGRIALDRLLSHAEADLRSRGIDADVLGEMLAPARALLIDSWQQGDSAALALFAAPGFFRLLRGRFPVVEEWTVGPRFRLRPLLPLLAAPERWYVLALSRNAVRLVEATPAGVRRLPLGELEAGFEAAMGYDEYYSALQVHAAGTHAGGTRRPSGVVHGHGDRDEEKLEEDLRHWLGRVAERVKERARDLAAPRVLATTTEQAALYRAASRDPLLLPETVAGNPDRIGDAELAERARVLVDAFLERRRHEGLDRWRELLGGPRASGDPATVLRLAAQGRVQALFLPPRAELWGTWDPTAGRLKLHAQRRPGDEELLERAAHDTLARGGEVHELGDPAALGGATLAALLQG